MQPVDRFEDVHGYSGAHGTGRSGAHAAAASRGASRTTTEAGVGWLEADPGRSDELVRDGFGLCDVVREPRQCREVTEDGEPNAIPVDSASLRRRLPRGVASARRLPASALGLLLPAGRWRRQWCNPRRRGPHGPACRRTRPAGLSGLGESHCAPSGLCRAAVPKSPCPLALILGAALASSLQIHAFLGAPKWMGQAPFSPSAATAPLLGRRSCHRPDRGESCASCSQRYAREDAAYAHEGLSCWRVRFRRRGDSSSSR